MRAYAVALAVLAFLVTWAAVAAHPWTGPDPVPRTDPRTAALNAREAHLVRRARVAQQVLDARWERYQRRLAARVDAIRRAQDGRVAPAGAAHGPPVVVWTSRRSPLAWTRSS